MYNSYSYTAPSYHSNHGFLIFAAIFLIISVVCYWRIFEKAGQPGWKAIIPIYNVVTIFKIAGLNPWLILLFLVPIVNIFVAGYMYISLGKKFGKDPFWSIILLFLLSTIGQLILAFGKAQYNQTSPTISDPPLPPVAPNVPTTNP